MKKMAKYPEKEWIKENLLKLAIEHKAKCKKPDCDIQLLSLFVVCKKMNIRLSKMEKKIFI